MTGPGRTVAVLVAVAIVVLGLKSGGYFPAMWSSAPTHCGDFAGVTLVVTTATTDFTVEEGNFTVTDGVDHGASRIR